MKMDSTDSLIKEEENIANINDDSTSYFVLPSWQTLIIITVIVALLLRNPVVRYYFNYAFFFSMVLLTCIVNIPLVLLRPKNPSNLILVYPFARFTASLLNINFELRGSEILEKERASVLIPNHQSSFDVLAHCCIMNVVKKCVIVSRKQLLYVLPYGIFMTLAGSIFIDRKGGKSANENLMKTTDVLAKHKAKLLIYPEGKRHLNADVLNPFKKGAFRVAIAGQFPILPMVISPMYFIDSKRKQFKPGNVILKVLEPISTTGLTDDDIDSLIEKTWQLMNEEYQKLKSEVECYKMSNNANNLNVYYHMEEIYKDK